MSEMKWIRCEDRLPEMHHESFGDEEWLESDPCLICVSDKHSEKGIKYVVSTLARDDDTAECLWDRFDFDGDCVLAWMPIPEYKEESA